MGSSKIDVSESVTVSGAMLPVSISAENVAFQDQLQKNGLEAIPFEKGALICGVNTLEGMGFPHLYVHDLYVNAEYRRTGVATAILERLEDAARQLQIKFLLGSLPDDSGSNRDHVLSGMKKLGWKLHAYENGVTLYSKEVN